MEYPYKTYKREWLSYGKTKYDPENDYSFENTEIRNTYKSVVNIRIGGEYRLKNYRFRAGYSLMPDPFQSKQNGVDRAISAITTGAGYRAAKFYVDMAVVYSFGDTSYRPYKLNYALDPLVTQSKNTTTILFTVGIPF